MRILMSCLLVIASTASACAASIWVEGEDAKPSTCKAHPWWYDKVKTDVLSGGAWHSNWNDKAEGLATYVIDVPEAGAYTLWLRGNPHASTMSYRLDDGDWQSVDWEQGKRGHMNIAVDNKPDMRFIQWSKPGELELGAGRHTLVFKYHSKNNNHGAIDCFALVTDRWVPSGTTRPGESAFTGEGEPADPDQAIWIEGEDGAGNATPHDWYNAVKHDVLSEGAWLHHFDKDRGATVNWSFEVIEGDTYTMWIRSNPLRSKLQWSIDGGAPEMLDHEEGKRGHMNIAKDNKPDLRFIQWNKVDEVVLSPGKHSLTIEIGGEDTPQNHGAIDAIVFSRIKGWVPSGAKKPIIPGSGSVEPDSWFPVIADRDEFSSESVIDMSELIPAPAGRFGRVVLDGHELKYEQTGERVHFWGIGSNQGGRTSKEEMIQGARFYRKHGINIVRQHTVQGAVGLLGKDGTLDPERLDSYDQWFATLKEHGIYSTWSVIYPHHGEFLREWEVANEARYKEVYERGKGRHGSATVGDYINLDRGLQDIALQYFQQLLEHENPYTGMRYKDDPALVVVEMQNESNVFFHTLNDLAQGQKMPAFSRFMEERWFQWAKQHYDDEAAVKQAWGGFKDGDKWGAGRLQLHGIWEFEKTSADTDAKQLRRIGDFINFYTDLQRDYYEQRYQDIRELGYGGLIVTTAWKGVGASAMANLYCDSVGDVIDRHNYFGGGAGGHRIAEGEVRSDTHLSQPGRGLLALAQFQHHDKPFAVSEWSYTPPAAYKAEAAPLMAFYGIGLQGWDFSYHFASSANRLGDGWPGLGKYVSHTPHYMGQFPALAYAIHKGHITTGEVVAHRSVNEAMLFAGWDVLGTSIGGGSHDYKDFSSKVVTPPEATSIGRITNDFQGGEGKEVDLGRFWDRGRKKLTSTTGELVWDYGEKLVEVRSPKTQAVIGFAGGKRIDLPAVRIRDVKTPFVSLIFTPLDDKPLAESTHILITAMARDKQTGAEFNDNWTELLQVGGPPLLMEPVQADLLIEGPKPTSIRALDIYGVPTERAVEIAEDGRFTIDGTYQTYYYEVRR